MQEKDVREIHEENVNKLSSMTMDELKAEREALLASLDPKSLEVLKSLRAKKKRVQDGSHDGGGSEEKSRKVVSDPEDGVAEQQLAEEVEKALPEDIREAKSKFLHMNEVEYEKLKWMTDLPAPEAKASAGGSQARFDFKGNLLAENDKDLPVTKGLHHHGEEPDKPGYSLSELFTLARSSFPAQKVVGLNVLAEIFKKVSDNRNPF